MRKKLGKAEPSRWEAGSTAAHYPTFSHKNMRERAAAGRGEIGSFVMDAARLFRTEPENLDPVPHVESVEDVTRGIVQDSADAQKIQGLVTDTNASFSQKTQTQRIFLARGRLTEVLRQSMRHIPADVRMEVLRRAGLFWKKRSQTDYGKEPTVRWKGNAAKQAPTKFVLPAQKFAKGMARGGKYYKRTPTGNPKRPWRYYYTRAQYEREHGGDKAHIEGFSARQEWALKRLEKKLKKRPDLATENRVWPNSTDFGLPEDTSKAHKQGGEYTKQRKALHAKIIEEATAKVQPVPKDKKPVAIVMMGGGGSGKGTIKKAVFGDLSDFVNVDPDEVKDSIPEYKQALDLGKLDGKTVTAKNAAFMAHEESSEVADQIRERAMAERKNVVLDGTGKDAEKYAKKLKALKMQGYHVKLVYAHVDKDEAVKRAKERADRGGRFVPLDILEDAHRRIPGNFQYVADHADEAVVFHSKKPPTPLYTQPPPNPVDKEGWSAFQTLGAKYHKELGITLPPKELAKADKRDGRKGGLPPSVSLYEIVRRVYKNGKKYADEDLKGPLKGPTDGGIPWPEPEYEKEVLNSVRKEEKRRQTKKSLVSSKYDGLTKSKLVVRRPKRVRLEW